jgi:ribosomal protein L5
VFPEVSLSKTSGSQGLEITVVTNTQDIRKSKKLLELLGMPFEKEE